MPPAKRCCNRCKPRNISESSTRRMQPRRVIRSTYIGKRGLDEPFEPDNSKRLKPTPQKKHIAAAVPESPPPQRLSQGPSLSATPVTPTHASNFPPVKLLYPPTPQTPSNMTQVVTAANLEEMLASVRNLIDADNAALDGLWAEAARKDWVAATDAHGEQAAMKQRRAVLVDMVNSFRSHALRERGKVEKLEKDITGVRSANGKMAAGIQQHQRAVTEVSSKLESLGSKLATEMQKREQTETALRELRGQKQSTKPTVSSSPKDTVEYQRIEAELKQTSNHAIAKADECIAVREKLDQQFEMNDELEDQLAKLQSECNDLKNDQEKSIGGMMVNKLAFVDVGERIWLQGEVERLKKQVERVTEERDIALADNDTMANVTGAGPKLLKKMQIVSRGASALKKERDDALREISRMKLEQKMTLVERRRQNMADAV